MTDYYHITDGILNAYTGREEYATVPEGVHTIGEGAFKGCTSLKEILLPPGLRRIMGGAFKGCRKLERIDIPAGVSTIGDYAFHRCHTLREISLPPSVTELGDCVFLYCDSLIKAQIPGVKRLGAQAFANDIKLQKLTISRELEESCICDVFTGCGNITEISFPDGEYFPILSAVEVVAGAIKVPSLLRTIAADILKMMELDGRRLVRFIANIKHVEVPEGIEVLAKSCFFDMRGVTTVKLPVSLRSIESRAFRNCINLEEVSFAGDRVAICKDAFKNCTSLKLVRTSRGEEYTFTGIVRPSEEEVPEIIQVIHHQLLGNFRISGTILLKYLGAESRVVIPEGITRIACRAFAGNEAVDRVILPRSLTEIGAEAFRDCLLLQTIAFPEGLKRIGFAAFENCVKLIRVQIPYGMKRLENDTFRHCRALREIVLPEGFQEIGEGAFYGCRSLKEILFPESLAFIGELAFYRCAGLKEIRLPHATKQVQSLAFAKSGVQTATLSADGEEYGAEIFGDCTRLKRLVLKEGVRHIPDKLACGCTALRQVVLPSTLISVGRYALEGTPFLARWTECHIIASAITDATTDTTAVLAEESVKTTFVIEESVFWDGRKLEGCIQLSNRVQIVAGGAFYGNTKLTKIRLPESVTAVGAAAFKGCRELRTVMLPSHINRAAPELFSGCVNLEEIIIQGSPLPPAWHVIGERAFFGCQSLQKICLAYTEFIGKEALAGCASLEKSPISPALLVGERAFESTAFHTQRHDGISIAGSLVMSGETCAGEISFPEGIRFIAPYAFAGNRAITKLILPESLTMIGEGAFFGCSSLLSVEFPEGIEKIGMRAFEKCTRLTHIHTKASQIEKAAFAFCTGLQSAAFPHVRILSDRLFEGCKMLKSCSCKQAYAAGEKSFCGCEELEAFDFSQLRIIHPYAFAGCDKLRHAVFCPGACLHEYAFQDCGRLEAISLEGELYLREYALSGCTALSQVSVRGERFTLSCYRDLLSEDIPEAARLVFQSALSCFEVEQEECLCRYQGMGRIVKIPAGIRRIEAEAFRNIPMLREISVPESVGYIGARAFHGTAWIELRKKESPMIIVNHMLLDGSGCAGEAVVTKDIHMVCGWAFANGLGIERIRFLSDRVRVEEHAFRNCVFLREIVLSDGTNIAFSGIADRNRELPPIAKQAALDSMNCFKTNTDGVLTECTGNISVLRLADGITAIGEGAFADGNLLTQILFPGSVTRIERRAFAGCKWLREVLGTVGVTAIDAMAFSGCGSLKRVELSEAFRTLGARAFENCISLEEILLPEGIEEIPERAFYRCHSLRKIVFPSTLKRIGKEAFAFCRQLDLPVLPEGITTGERAFFKEV